MESEVFVWLVRMAKILLISFTLGRLLCCWSKKGLWIWLQQKTCLRWLIFFFPLFSFTLLFTIFWFLFSCPLTLAPSLFLFNACLHKKRNAVFGSKQKCHIVISSHEFLCLLASVLALVNFFPFHIFHTGSKTRTNLYRFAILTNFNVDNNRVTARLLSVPTFYALAKVMTKKMNSNLNSNLNMNQMNCNIYYSTPISSLGKITCLIIWQHQLNYRHWCSLMSSNVWPFVQTFKFTWRFFFQFVFSPLFFLSFSFAVFLFGCRYSFAFHSVTIHSLCHYQLSVQFISILCSNDKKKANS